MEPAKYDRTHDHEQGLGAKEAAEMLGIGEPTARSHLQRIFSKTNTTRQADLLRLLQSSTPPLLSAQRAVG